MAALISFSGLPGVGKTAIARILAQKMGATYIRVDSIEAALKRSTLHIHPAEDAGYLAAVASDNLKLGFDVIADTVNPIEVSRRLWLDAAISSSAKLLNVEIVCSDKAEHRRRVETRQTDLDDLKLPDWNSVQGRHYEDWAEEQLILDASRLSASDCVKIIIEALGKAP